MRPSPGLFAAALLSCTLLTSCQAIPAPAPETARHDVVLRIDPAAGPDRRVAATLESRLALTLDAAGVRQEGDVTHFDLVVRNDGSAVSDLNVRLASDRPVVSPTGALAFGALAPGAEARQAVRYSNPGGAAFSVTVSLWATLTPSGTVRTASR